MAEIKLCILVLAVLAIHHVMSRGYHDHCYCVEPSSGNSSFINPCNSSCRPLQYYANVSASLGNNSIFRFLPGTHILSAVFYVEHRNNVQFVTYPARDGGGGGRECGGSKSEDDIIATVVECEGSGFYFRSIVNLTIVGLTFNNCGYEVNHKYWNAFLLHYVWNLYVHDVAICNTEGVGIYAYEVVGNSTISSSIFNSSRRASPGNSSSSGNIHLYYEFKEDQPYHHYLTIVDSEISHGNNSQFLDTTRPHAGGLFLYLFTTNAIHILLLNVNISGNSGYNGGNAAVDYIATGNSWLSTITIQNCRFLNGYAHGFGAGLYATFIALYNEKYLASNLTNSTVVMNVTGSHFSDNKAGKVGAGAYVQLHENRDFETVANISFTNCHFENNYILSTTGRGGSAVNVINFRIPDYIPHHLPQYVVFFHTCHFTRNHAVITSNVSLGSSALYVEENAYMILSDCSFRDNGNCSGLSAVHSNLMLRGEIGISNNTAVNGGGIVLCANSVLHLSINTMLTISGNSATRYGGGIFNEDDCLQAIPPCFFQVDSTANLNKTVFLLNNTATKAGSALFGGSVDYCYYYGTYKNNENRKTVFDDLFEIATSNPNDTSNISSNPIRVCFCEGPDGKYNCSEQSRFFPVFSGGQVKVNVVVVGQRYGAVPGVVMARVLENKITLQSSEYHQIIPSSQCKGVTYTVELNEPNALNGNTTITLNTENNIRNTSNEDTNIYIEVLVQPCPPGFSLNNEKDVCQCGEELSNLQKIGCNITKTCIERQKDSAWWIGFDDQKRVVYNENCPFDYCVTHHVEINVTVLGSQDRQCANYRQGVLCGKCQANMSTVMGSTHCYDCSHSTVWQALGKVLLFALAGILIVLFIGIFNLNVTEGTLNAFIFYMNIVKFNTSYFDLSRDASIVTKSLSVFVSWISFDLETNACFYDGMTIVGKTALGCMFPFYLWFLAGLIIFLGRKQSWVVKIFGKDTVKVLATIILHSYAKLIRSLINIWSPTALKSSGKDQRLVWTLNGNIEYFHDKYHLALFVLALVVAAVTLPYTLALLFIQCLRRRSNMKVLFWVNKLKPFFDAYTGPYKDKYHFWTGVLLIVRIVLFVSIRAIGSPTANLTLIIGTISLLLFFMQPGIYKNRGLNVIETFSYLNLIVFSALTLFDKFKNETPIMVCVGSMFLLFCGVVIYHILKKLSVTQRWGLVKVWLLDRRWPWMKRKQIRSLILPYVDPDNDEDQSSSDSELDPILHNAPPVARYDEYREPLIETTENS